MAKRNGKKFKNKGYPNTPSSSKIIDKWSVKGNNHNSTRSISNSLCIPHAALNYDHAPSYPNVPIFPNVPASTANCNWAAVRAEEIHSADQMSGYIFMCNGKTKTDCYKYRVFGLPASRMEAVAKIKPHMKLFLFDFDIKLLYGVYVAASIGKLAIEPTAFGGRFSAQVRFEVFKECLPLPESSFKNVIKDNYVSGFKFRQELSGKQVADLVSLFRPLAESPTAFPLMQSTAPTVILVHSNIEVQTQLAAGTSASYDQYLARQQLIPVGVAQDYQRVQEAVPHLPHASHPLATNVAGLQPAVESMHLLPLVPQPQQNQFFPLEAHHTYCSQNTSSDFRDTPKPDASGWGNVPQSGHTSNYYKHNTVVSTSNALVQANAVPLQLSTPGHAYVPSLTTTGLMAAYWVQVAVGAAESVYAGTTYPAATENTERETVLKSCAVIDNNHNLAHAASNPPPGAQYVLLQQFQVPLQYTTVSQLNPAYEAHQHNGTISCANGPSQVSSETAGYWSVAAHIDPNQMYLASHQTEHTYEHNVAVSDNNASLQAHNQVPSHFAAASHVPSSSEVPDIA